VEVEVAGFDPRHLPQAEREEDRQLEPLVDDPDAVHFLRHPHLAAIECVDRPLHCFPGIFDGQVTRVCLLDLLSVRHRSPLSSRRG
jgi:hypothetical protein